MTNGYDRAHRLAVIEGAKALTCDAIAAAQECEAESSAWRFYNGVETAALHVLYPEMANVREATAWLDREYPSFLDGFLEASALLGMAAAAPQPPSNSEDWFARSAREDAGPTWLPTVAEHYVRINPTLVTGRRLPAKTGGVES